MFTSLLRNMWQTYSVQPKFMKIHTKIRKTQNKQLILGNKLKMNY